VRIIHLFICINDTYRERSSPNGNCIKYFIKSEESLKAEHNTTDKRLSLNIISTHCFEKWSLALISGRAGVWDKVQLANLNLKNTERKNTLYIDKRRLYVTTETARVRHDNNNNKLQNQKELKMDWIEADFIQPTWMNAVIKFSVSL